MNKSYKRKTVVVTGSSKGIGRATIKEFAKNGYNVVINYINDEKSAFKLEEEIKNKYHVETLVIKADISNEDMVKSFLEQVKLKFNTIDVLVNNAGIAIDSTLEDKSVINFKKILDVNLIGTFLMCKYFGSEMCKQKYGSIINVSSTNGIDSYYPYSLDYDASKAGVISLTHNFAILYAPYIKVNTIAPGWTNTEAIKEMDEELIKEEYKHILLERFAEPEEIAQTIYFMANAPYLNDAIIKVDGGRC